MGSSSTGRSSMGSSSARGQWSREDVKSVQEALKGKGLNPGPIDGVMGPQTQQALRSFQRSQNIQQSGQLDSSTASALGVQLSSGASGGAATGAGSSATGTGSSGSSGTGSSSSSGSTDSGSSSGAGGSSRGGAGSGTGSGTGSGAGSGAGSSSGSSGSSR
jgi:peptidoglycan hydrolase-like protein with peptidoglycan-binding domain